MRTSKSEDLLKHLQGGRRAEIENFSCQGTAWSWRFFLSLRGRSRQRTKGQRGVGQRTKQKQEVADSGIFHGRLGSTSGYKEKKEGKGHLWISWTPLEMLGNWALSRPQLGGGPAGDQDTRWVARALDSALAPPWHMSPGLWLPFFSSKETSSPLEFLRAVPVCPNEVWKRSRITQKHVLTSKQAFPKDIWHTDGKTYVLPACCC